MDKSISVEGVNLPNTIKELKIPHLRGVSRM